MSPSIFVLTLALMAGCGNQAEGASKADIGSLKGADIDILAPFGSPDCSLCGECYGVCINDMANLSSNTFDYVASVGPWTLGEVSLPVLEFGTVCVPTDVMELEAWAFDRIYQYITAINIQPQFGDVDNPVFCNCTGFSFLNGDEQSEGFGRSLCLTPLDEANDGNNLMTNVTQDEIKSFFKKFSNKQ